MNKLDEIFNKYKEHLRDSDGEFEGDFLDREDFKLAALEFAKHLLEEATLNANVIDDTGKLHSYVYVSGDNYSDATYEVNKQSIVEVLNKYL